MMDYDDDPSRYQIDFVGGETKVVVQPSVM